MRFRNQSSKIEELRQIPLLRGLSQRHLSEVAKHADELEVPAGRALTTEGRMGQEMFIIVEGKARVERGGHTIRTAGPGDVIGEMSLIDGKPRSATVIADEPMTLLVVSAREFKPLIELVPGFAQGLLKALATRLRDADESLVG